MLACTLGHTSACQFEHFLRGIHVLMNAAKWQYRDHSLSSLSYHSSLIMLIRISALRYLKFKDQCPGRACDWPLIHNIGWPLNFSHQMGVGHYHKVKHGKGMHVNKETSIDYPAHSNKGANKQCFWLPLWPGKQIFGWSYVYFWLRRKFVLTTPTTNYVIKVCDKQAVNYIYMYWLMAEYEYSVFQFGLCLGGGGGENSIQYTEPHPHIYIKLQFPRNLSAPQNPTALATHFSKCISIKHHHWNLATW